MKLYRHYKNKPYTYRGVVKHSETLEDLVLYECRYPNELATVWVRPRDMFEETLEVNGETKRRFAPIALEVQESNQIDDSTLALLGRLMESCGLRPSAEQLWSRLENRRQFHVLVAKIEGRAVGFKVGYAHDHQVFESWLGGVIPEYRGLGIASELMSRQHDWCHAQGYERVRAFTENQYREMLTLSLREGFQITGTHVGSRGSIKIHLEKDLRPRSSGSRA